MPQYTYAPLESNNPKYYGAVNVDHIYLNNDPSNNSINTIINNLNNKIILLSNYENIGKSGDDVLNTDYDDTASIQDIIDTCDINCEIIFDKNKTYKISNLLIDNKSIKINLNGCHIIASPMTNCKALFYFKGRKTQILNDDNTEFKTVIKKSDNSVISLPIEEDCDIIMEDSTIVEGWDEDSSSNQNIDNYDADNTKLFSGSYQGRGELNYYIHDKNKLSKPVEFDYGEDDNENNKAKVFKVNFIKSPIIDGGGCLIEEVDFGLEYTDNNGENMPSLFQFDYCENANIHDIYVNGWNYKVVSALYCKNMSVTNIIAKNAFRPTIAAHGYLIQFVRCLNTFTSKNISYNARHLVDYVNSIDGYSSNNHAYDGVWAQYISHGMGSNRIVSENDTCMNCHDGWSVGNASFNGDYDFTIINPTFIGDDAGSEGIIVCSSENTKIINPLIKSKGKGIFVLAGSKNTSINGGVISGLSDPYTSILVRGSVTDDSNAYKIVPKNVEIKNVNMNNSAFVYIEMEGDLRIENNIIANTTNNSSNMIRVLDFGIVKDHGIKDYFLKSNILSSTNYYEGTNDNGDAVTSCVLKTYMEPTGRYEVMNNFFSGKNPIFIPPRTNMIFCNNKIDASEYEFSKEITNYMLQSSIIDLNIPSIYDSSMRTNVKGSTNNDETIFNIRNINFLAIAHTESTILEALIHKCPIDGITITIYSYNNNITIPLDIKAYRTEEDYNIAKSGGSVNYEFEFRFSTSDGDIVFPTNGGAITFIYYDKRFIEINRSF